MKIIRINTDLEASDRVEAITTGVAAIMSCTTSANNVSTTGTLESTVTLNVWESEVALQQAKAAANIVNFPNSFRFTITRADFEASDYMDKLLQKSIEQVAALSEIDVLDMEIDTIA